MNEENGGGKMPDEEMGEGSSPVADQNTAGNVTESPEEKKVTREDELLAEIAGLNDKYLRLSADFENFRKRSAKESSERAERSVEHVVLDLLEIVDNIDRALNSDESSLREGVEQIHKLLMKILQNHSISPVESLKEQFDPNMHEAIAYVPSDCEEGIVIDEVTRGYCMKDKVIRCAKVAVSKGKKEE